MINAYNALFDFSDPLIDIFSMLPTNTGNFSKDIKNKPILMKVGNQKYQELLKNIDFVEQTLNQEMQPWKHKNARSMIGWLLCLIYDNIYPGIEEKYCTPILEKVPELIRRALYADRFQDEGIMFDYLLEEIKTKNNKKLQKYSNHMHGIGSGTEIVGWPEYFSRLWNNKKHPEWKEAIEPFTFHDFLSDIV